MADIYAFPTGESNDGRPVRPQGVPDEVWAAVESVSTMKRIHDVRYREIPIMVSAWNSKRESVPSAMPFPPVLAAMPNHESPQAGS